MSHQHERVQEHGIGRVLELDEQVRGSAKRNARQHSVGSR